MRAPDSFPVVSLIGFGKMLSQFLGKPLEKAVASSPEHRVIAIRDEGGFDITEEPIERPIRPRRTAKVPTAVGLR